MMLTPHDSRTASRPGVLVLLAACLIVAAVAWVMRLVVGVPATEEDDAWGDGVDLLGPVLATLH